MAKSLEEHLYRSAQTKEEYLDPSTLKKRLQLIAHGLEIHRSSSSAPVGVGAPKVQSSSQQGNVPSEAEQLQQFLAMQQGGNNMNMSQNSMVMGGVQNNTPMDMFQGLGGGMDTSINGMDQSQSDNMNSNQDLVAAQKKKVIRQQQQRLLLLRHASKCKEGPSCKTKFCSQMMTLWKHMKKCRDKNCKTSHCLSSRCVLNHYRICKSQGRTSTCEVCGPVMEQIKRQDLEGPMDSSDPLAAKPDPDLPAQAIPQLQQPMSGFIGSGNQQNNMQAMQQQAMQQLFQQQQEALQNQQGGIQGMQNQNIQNQQGGILGMQNQNIQNQQGGMHGMQNQNIQNQQGGMQGLQNQNSLQALGGGGMQGMQNEMMNNSQNSGGQDLQQMQNLQSAQQKLQQQQQVLQQLQKQQNQLQEQQRQLQEQQAMLTDPGTQQAQQLQQQHQLLQQLQRRCQQQQALIQQDLMLQMKTLEQGSQDMHIAQHQLIQTMDHSQRSQQMGNSQNSHHSQSSNHLQGNRHMGGMSHNQSNDLMTQMQNSLQNESSADEHDLLQMQQVLKSQHSSSPGEESLERLKDEKEPQPYQELVLEEGGHDPKDKPRLGSHLAPQGVSEPVDDTGRTDEASKEQEPSESNDRPRTVGGRGKGARGRGGKGKRLRDIADDLGSAGAPLSATDATSISERKRDLEALGGDDERPTKQLRSDGQMLESEKNGEGETSSSLTSSMPKGDVEQHLLLLHKGLHLTSRTITHKCLPIVQQLIDDPFGWVFRDAVDPVVFGLPDYFEVVKNPMHLLLVKKKLENAVYTDMASFERDVKLVFENAILYNGEESEVGQLAQTMMGVFEREYKKVCEGM
jgi:Bromodomain/TAZ zinc finger